MQKLEAECTCPTDWTDKHCERCAACEGWWQQNSILCRELRLPPWEFPAVQHPDAVPAYPKGSPAYEKWQPDLAAQARWRALMEAAT